MEKITMMEAVSITVSSMAIVFITLILIACAVGSFKFIFKQKPKAQVKTEAKPVAVNNTINEEEKLVVCLAAAAMAGNGKIDPNLHIKRVTKIS